MADPELRARFVILAPLGRDAGLTAELLGRAGLTSVIAADLDELLARVGEGAAGVMIAEEALTTTASARLEAHLAAQPAWSDLPIIVFSRKDGGVRVTGERFALPFGNVVVLDRPVRPIAMVSAARASLRARARQYQAEAELEAQREAVRRRDEFLAMLGHELRNPLAAITLALEALDTGAGEPGRYRAIVRRQAEHLTRLVDDFLDVSRVTSGKIVLRRDPVEVRELVRRCATALEGAFRAQRIELRVELGPAPLVVEGDAVRLEQVTTNLLTNALKYTPAGGHVRIEAVAGEPALALIRVSDDGVGISADMLPRVFDLFTQVVDTLDRAKGGLGLGLTLVRSLIELHGGLVRATSPGLGQGSSFTIELPRAEAALPASAPAAPEVSRPIERVILLVEDNPDNRETLQSLLDADGHRVAAVDDGLRAVAEAVRAPPEVMIVDVGLPGIDGYEVARRVRSALGPDVYLIAVTGYGQPEDRRRALAAGFDLHLTKPVDTGRLRRMLRAPALAPPATAQSS